MHYTLYALRSAKDEASKLRSYILFMNHDTPSGFGLNVFAMEKTRRRRLRVISSLIVWLLVSLSSCDNTQYGYTATSADYALVAAAFDADQNKLICDIHISLNETSGNVLVFLYGTRELFLSKESEPLESVNYSKSALETLFATELILPLESAEFRETVEFDVQNNAESRIIEWTFVLSDIESNITYLQGEIECAA